MKINKKLQIFICAFLSLSVIIPFGVNAEEYSEDYSITPFSYSENELEEYEFSDTDLSFSVPITWAEEEMNDYSVYFPDKKNKDEYIEYYLIELGSPQSSATKQVEEGLDYILNDYPADEAFTLLNQKTEYYTLKQVPMIKTSFDCISKTDKTKSSSVVYIVPGDTENVFIEEVHLKYKGKQKYAVEEEACLLTTANDGQYIFRSYLDSIGSANTAAAIVRNSTAGISRTAAAAVVSTPEPTPIVQNITSYVLNTNTGKFHYPNCPSVSQMKSKNRWDVNMTREEVIQMGYVPCKRCNP